MKLNEKGIKVCSDLWTLSLVHLQKALGLGEKTGQSLWEACRGMDKRPVQVREPCWASPLPFGLAEESRLGIFQAMFVSCPADPFLPLGGIAVDRRCESENNPSSDFRVNKRFSKIVVLSP